MQVTPADLRAAVQEMNPVQSATIFSAIGDLAMKIGNLNASVSSGLTAALNNPQPEDVMKTGKIGGPLPPDLPTEAIHRLADLSIEVDSIAMRVLALTEIAAKIGRP